MLYSKKLTRTALINALYKGHWSLKVLSNFIASPRTAPINPSRRKRTRTSRSALSSSNKIRLKSTESRLCRLSKNSKRSVLAWPSLQQSSSSSTLKAFPAQSRNFRRTRSSISNLNLILSQFVWETMPSAQRPWLETSSSKSLLRK